MKTLKYLSFAVLAICMASCGEKKSSSVSISYIDYNYDDMTRSLRDLVTIESDECVIKKNALGQTTSLVLESRCSNSDDEKSSKIEKISNGTIVLELLDENDVGIGEMGLENSKELFTWLKTADFLAKKEFSFEGRISDDVISKVKKIKYKYKETTSSTESSGIISDSDSEDIDETNNDIDIEDNDNDNELDDDKIDDDESDIDSEDWNALLKSYEQYVDKYIALMKKVSNGDMSAMAEYASLLSKAQDLSKKMEKAKGQMSVSQWEKYNKITMKMAKAIEESN